MFGDPGRRVHRLSVGRRISELEWEVGGNEGG